MRQPVNSVAEYVDAVIQVRNEWFPEDSYPDLWFRGSDDSDFSLLPGAYWRKNCDEASLALSFRSIAPAYLLREPADGWEWYYLMQHYSVPTRLLDWTESALVALFFAVRTCENPRAPCVWLMDPTALNRAGHGPDEDALIVPGNDIDLEYWLPGHCGRGIKAHKFPEKRRSRKKRRFTDNRKPLAIFPRRNNPRIVAQRGTFTVHGADESSIENVITTAAAESGSKAHIAKILVSLSDLGRIRSELHTLGTDYTALFPEPHSVGRDLHVFYGVN